MNKIKKIRFRIYYMTFFKVKCFIRRKINRFIKFNRPNSFPYITGDGFRSIAQHVFDEISDFNPEDVMEKDIVFVRGDFLSRGYFKKIHPKIKNKYILISHNSDENIDESYSKYIDEKIIHWFCQNQLFRHDKVTPIPIGLKLKLYDPLNKVIELIEKNKNNLKDIKILYAFSKETNQKRILALEELKKNNLSTGSEESIPIEKYYESISKNHFIASPEGGGVDCHRVWESLYLNSIPILERNILTKYWQEIGLPVLLIDSWRQVSDLNIDKLEIAREQNKFNEENRKIIYINYWFDKILKYKK